MVEPLRRWIVNGAALLAAIGLVWAAIVLQPVEGVAPLVQAHLAESGVENPVTAMLLNFRGTDTLLEIAVLNAAAVALFMLRPVHQRSPSATQPITTGPRSTVLLRWFVPRVVPLAAMMAGYLWWAGAALPGGAFQAGAVLGAAVILLLLGGIVPVPNVDDPRIRATMVGGLVAFLLLAVLPMMMGLAFLQYPPGLAGPLILGIEAILTISIAACLVELVAGVPPSKKAGP